MTTSLLVLHAAGLHVAVPTAEVRQVVERLALVGVPRPRPAVLGFFEWQDALIPLLDLSAFLGVARPLNPRWVVVENEQRLLALAVERVAGVQYCLAKTLRHPSRAEQKLPAKLLRAIRPDPTMVLQVLQIRPFFDYVWRGEGGEQGP